MKNPTSRWWAIASSMLAFGGLAIAATGCGEESAETDPTASGGGTSPTGGAPTGGPGSGGSDSGAGGSTPDGCEPGEVRACEIPVGTQNGVLTCIAGQEACRSNGSWGPCEGAVFARSADGLPDGLRGDELRDRGVIDGWLATRTSAVTLASGVGTFPGDDGAVHRAESDSEPCDSPCDPDCEAFPNPLDPEVPDSTLDQEPIGGTLLEFIESVAGGLLDKLFPDPDTCDSPQDCNVDTNCNDDDDLTNESDPDTTSCDAWGDGEFDDEAGGADFTVGAGCGAAGSQQVPVCNRGSTAYVGNLTAWIFPADSPQIPNCVVENNKNPQKACTFPVDLDPGECTEMPASCWAGVGGNNKSILINPSRVSPAQTPVAEGPTKTCNNWGFWDKDVPCASCTDSWEAELDEDDDDNSFCGVYFDMEVDLLADDRMIYLEYRSADAASWTPITWVWNDRWDNENSWEEDGCSGGNQAFIYEHTQDGDLHYHVRLCDDLCDAANAASDPAVRFTYDCPRTFEDELTDSVVYQGICPPATRVSWGYLGFNGVTPGNSRIEIEGRTGTADPPTDGDFIELATARDNYSGDEVSPACLLTDPDDECPIDLFAAFDGAPDANQEYLEVQYTLVSSGDNKVAPRLYELYATFTCPDSE